MNRSVALVLLVAAGVALVLRCPQLDRRPMHNDEAVNAIKFRSLWEEGFYRYDPNEHHGPTLHYATLVLSRLTGAPDFVHFTEKRFRFVTVLFGVGLIALLALFADGLGNRAAGWAALFIAVSPANVFYSRYFIHEMLLVFFTMLALGAAWRWWRQPRLGWAALAGAAVGLMHATKETFVITLAIGVTALLVTWVWRRWIESQDVRQKHDLPWKHLGVLIAAWLVVAVVLLSAFFSDASGPINSARTYLPWLERAGGESTHIHPWHFYLSRLLYFHPDSGAIWSEALIVALAVVGGYASLFRKSTLREGNAKFIQFLAFYTVALTAAYSFIAYKTPWCLLSFWNGMILLAGVGASTLVGATWRLRGKIVTAALAIGGAGHLAWQAWQGSFVYAADPRNPYVYAQTSPDITNLVSRVESLAQVHPQGHDLLVQVMAPEADYWPLPWSLRAFPHTGWWSEVPDNPFAPVMIVSSQLKAVLDERKTHLMSGNYQLRPHVFFELYVELDLWRNYLQSIGTNQNRGSVD